MSGSDEIERAARTLVDERVEGVARRLTRPLPPHPPPRTTPPLGRDYLFDEARELYANELRWEQETEEEQTASGELTEMVFPGFLALVDALVLPPGPGDERESHRDVVYDLLNWLAERVVTLGRRRPSPTPRVQEVVLADRLIDLVLYRYLELDSLEVETVDADRG